MNIIQDNIELATRDDFYVNTKGHKLLATEIAGTDEIMLTCDEYSWKFKKDNMVFKIFVDIPVCPANILFKKSS